ncbi:MAG TPA: hypothetical protein VFE54_05805 [Mucilaginibacter sp.]|jgi:hypothetical protein|nr:hypothetical protein [Mucilaginibacter sp.]
MTAEIGLLNKSGVVIAADSAVTISRVNKVFNNATKIFQLSDDFPVGIMIYNNASWMGIPLEIIIKQYKKKIKETSFKELKEYADDFIIYLKSNFLDMVTEDQVLEFIENRFYGILETLIESVNSQFDERIESKEIDQPKTIDDENKEKNTIFNEFIDALKHKKISEDILSDFENYTFKDFLSGYKKVIEKILANFYLIYNLTRKGSTTTALYRILYDELIHSFDSDEDFSGLVFAGYGEDEIFPSIAEIKLGEVLSKKLRYVIKKDITITHDNSAIVIPFAKRDMIDTFFQGVDPVLVEKMNDVLIEELETLVSYFNKTHKVESSKVRDKTRKAFDNFNKKLFDFRKESHVNPIITSVSYLRKEDLVELAESLVNITSLKRKTSHDLQSVGGPVDIAIITKAEGFIWAKRKDVIPSEINLEYYIKELTNKIK